MTQLHTPRSDEQHQPSSRSRHGWLMIACCIPLLAIAIVFVATGVASASFLIPAIACMAMMGLMMAMMMGGISRGGK